MYQPKRDKDIRCPLEYGLDIFGGKWNSRIICVLAQKKVLRYNELKKELSNVTDAVLAAALKSLIRNGMINRKSYDEIPPKVEYSLTEKGFSVVPILQSIAQWAGTYQKDGEETGGTTMLQCQKCDYSCKEPEIAGKSMEKLTEQFPIIREMQKGTEVVWINPHKTDGKSSPPDCDLAMTDIEDAEQRLSRFAPFLIKCFPETKPQNGRIESELVLIPAMQEALNQDYHAALKGKLLLKKDSDLPIAGSVKARGGIYEVLKHTEDLALKHGLLRENDSYEKLASPEARDFFSQYTIQVGSTGNLGMSIGIMSAAVGYRAIVHMSLDAKQWKKDLLRSHGVQVIEYETDYGEAVKNGRQLSSQNPNSYFVDDENSQDLFLGYAAAAKRLPSQLRQLGISVDFDHPLFVYIPCGIGGAPGGISFGLKQVYGDAVHCFFAEPTQAPCMALGMATGLNDGISVQDIGLSGLTQADGLAVGRPSSFVGTVMKPLLSGEFTVKDNRLFEYLRILMETEHIFLEPSACAGFQGPAFLNQNEESRRYLREHRLADKMERAAHIVWATGGSLVPEDVRKEYLDS